MDPYHYINGSPGQCTIPLCSGTDTSIQSLTHAMLTPSDTRLELFIVMTSLTLHCQDILDTLGEKADLSGGVERCRFEAEVWAKSDYGLWMRRWWGRKRSASCGGSSGSAGGAGIRG